MIRFILGLTLSVILPLGLAACSSGPRLGDRLPRQGDEIVIAGQYFHTGAPVVLWTDPGGYDAYRVERRFVPLDKAEWAITEKEWAAKNDGTVVMPNRYGMRQSGLSDADKERIRGGGWSLAEMQDRLDQFVLHYDVCGTSRQCFNILHDHRGLSIHFMIDVDGTIYQTLDLKERARHATIANDRSVGVEIANMGAYPAAKASTLNDWYAKDANGQTFLKFPPRFGDGGLRVKDLVFRPARNEPVVGEVQGMTLTMYDLTPQQYASLAKLSATLCTVLPKIRPDYPRDASGALITRTLPEPEFTAFTGILGHYHVQQNKQDPGPAMNWDWLVSETRRLMENRPRAQPFVGP
jgi:N-acetyl-anhydromuramyl-L-alanine amidase AmpD